MKFVKLEADGERTKVYARSTISSPWIEVESILGLEETISGFNMEQGHSAVLRVYDRAIELAEAAP